ncbi:hypothetical protein PF008_g5806 [Phytophthora fragariae]|uniref:F-box domain-containing protein n=1 Tax=Phytophthora fragariae TaxID=53985 RepID=A0A6G0S797_9STRA|nr:hypothetical protein PF008_g5806 [Phytophthora fragariae]
MASSACSSPRRRPKRPATDDHHSCSPSATSPSSQWIRSIQNQSFEPKPTAYSPHALRDEDPLMLQQRQCRDKLRALRQVRERMTFHPQLRRGDAASSSSYSMKIVTSLVLSQDDNSQSDGHVTRSRQNVGIDALGGLEMLLFAFFSRHELLRVTGVCRAWRALARDDLFWESQLFTPHERYPLRPLLGLERDPTHRRDDIPAILVYMVYQRLKLAQAAYTVECSDDTSSTNMETRYNGRMLELFQTLNRQVQLGALPRQRAPRRQGEEAVSSVHLVCAKCKPAVMTSRTQEDQVMTRMAANLNLEAMGIFREEPAVGAPNGAVQQQNAGVNGQNGAGAADDDDVYSVADGRERVTLSAWLTTKRRVCERTLRSFLRQMLLAVDALERSNCEHSYIWPGNIVVHSLPRIHKSEVPQGASNRVGSQPGEESDDEDETDDDNVDMVETHELETKGLQDYHFHSRRRTPFFQLFLSRRNCQHTGGAQGRGLDRVLAADAEVNLPDDMLNGDGLREIAEQRQRLAGAGQAEAGFGNGVGNNGGQAGGVAAVFHNRLLALPHPIMVSSVLQTAMTVWARGRFVDPNASTVLAMLLRYPASFSSGLRGFLEYAKYLIITHSATASKLLRHDYLQCPESQLDRKPSRHWSTTPINHVNEYKSKLVAYYGSLPSRVEGLLDDKSSCSLSPAVIDELMPRTTLGVQYFVKALEEANLPQERFVSVVAPSTASSSWVRSLALTQTCTLQRLDLSQARVPMSVLLQELAMLPRLTHLRLPRQILRDENLEHLVAALAYADLLPRLRCLDENVRQAMDRMEKSYLMQLDMVTFLLQKPSASNQTRAGA